jgi:hypothetical protein
MATAVSNSINNIWINISINTATLAVVVLFPNSVISRWPAIIFAINRTARAPGRIMFLMVSMQTINGISIAGVPDGMRWANIIWVLLIHPNNIRLTQRGIASDSVNTMCLDLVNTYGSSPSILLVKIKKNRAINSVVNPIEFIFINNLNSICRVIIIFLKITLIRFNIIQ